MSYSHSNEIHLIHTDLHLFLPSLTTSTYHFHYV